MDTSKKSTNDISLNSRSNESNEKQGSSINKKIEIALKRHSKRVSLVRL